ncbi:hypothetical protein PSP6_440438 [Paraburkholderia tropica]|nr:hypothetical protein PSP6_440438 [Paraburkholderia tropica]
MANGVPFAFFCASNSIRDRPYRLQASRDIELPIRYWSAASVFSILGYPSALAFNECQPIADIVKGNCP